MNLEGGSLYWPATTAVSRPARPLTRDLRCRVLVAGAGITGAMTAYRLARAGIDVVVVDRRAAAAGSTAASTALVQYDLDRSLTTLSRMIGPGPAADVYRAAARAVDEFRRVARSLGRDVEVAPRESLYLARREDDVVDLRVEADARRAIGLRAQFLARPELRRRFSIDRPGAVLSSPALEANPVKLTLALLDHAAAHGALVFDHSELDLAGISRDDAPSVITVNGRTRISADWVVVATGYETPVHFEAVARLTSLRSTYAIATAPLTGAPWPGRALVWECGDPYFYARTSADGRVLAGGEDVGTVESAARDALIPAKAEALAEALRVLAPGTDPTPEFAWAGTFAQTADGLPCIGLHPEWPRALFALGYGGNGMTFSIIAAQIITGIVTGRPHPCASLFSFERPSARSAQAGSTR